MSKLKVVKLDVVKNFCSYIQVPQTSATNFALLNRVSSKSFREIHFEVKCREYFGDALICAHANVDMPKIYGFSLTDERMAIDETLLSVAIKDDSVDSFIKHLSVIRSIEAKMGLPKTKVYLGDSTVYAGITKLVIVADKKWSSSPLLISIYTLLLRSCSYRTGKIQYHTHTKALTKVYNGNDSGMLKEILRDIDLIHFLVNFDEVVGDNPLTGADDTFLIKELKKIECFNSPYLEIKIPVSFKGKERQVPWSISKNHANHGIFRFCNTLKDLEKGEDDFFNYYGNTNMPINIKTMLNYGKLVSETT